MSTSDPMPTAASRSTDMDSSPIPLTEQNSTPDSIRTQAPTGVPETHPGTDVDDDPIATRGPVDPYATVRPDERSSTGFEARASNLIPGFDRLELVGEGGMGAVYKARQVGLNREVALKVVLGGRLASPKDLIRFLAEAEAVASIRHPNVVQVHEFGEADGRPFLAMEYLPGGSLADRLKAGGRLDPMAAAGLVGKLARAVQAAHDQEIVHRDLKPGNVLFDDAGEPRVTDFGLAKRASGGDLTGTQAVMGTPAYMAPEQARGETKFVGPQADIYALGVVLYECLTGTRPFHDADTLSLLRKVVEDEPERPARRVPGLPRDLELIALKCLAKDPADRYPTAMTLAVDLVRFLNGEPVTVRAAGPAERALKWARRKPTLAASYALTAAVLILSAFGASLAVLWRSAEGQRRDALIARDGERQARVAAESQRREAVAAREDLRKAQEAQQTLREQLTWDHYGRTIHQAFQDLKNNNNDLARALLLDRASIDQKGWEWKYVLRLCDTQLLTLKPAHAFGVTTGSWSPDGSRLATGGWDATTKIWDARTGALILTLRDGGTVESVSWSPDGSRLATGGFDGIAKVWDPRTGKEVTRCQGHTAPLTSVSWSRDGSRLATASQDTTARVWDAKTGAELLAFRGHTRLVSDKPDPKLADTAAVQTVAWSPDGSRLASGGVDRLVRVWDAKTGAELLAFRGHTGKVWAVAWSPDGSRIASAGGGRSALIWDASTGDLLTTLAGHNGGITALSWNPTGSRVLTGSFDKMAKVWDGRSGEDLLTLNGHEKFLRSVAWNPDGSQVVTTSDDKSVKVWDVRSASDLKALTKHAGPVLAVTWSPDGSNLATAGDDKTVKVWDIRSGSELKTLRKHDGPVHAVAWSPDGSTLTTASADKSVHVWDARSGSDLRTLNGHRGAVNATVPSPDGSRMATTSDDGTTRVWDPKTGAELLTLDGHAGPVHAVAWSPDGSRLATGGSDAALRIWDARPGAGAEPMTLRGHTGAIQAVVWSPDGLSLATASDDGTARIWDAHSGASTVTLEGHTGAVRAVAWSPDGSRLATGGVDKTTRVWGARFGTDLLTLKEHTGAVRAVAWSPDGSRMATGSDDGTARIWDARSGAELLGAQAH